MNEAIENLRTLFNRGTIHVVGRTAYRTVSIIDHILDGDRELVSFLEDKLVSKDNHVVLIFQVLWSENGWLEGTYYMLLIDPCFVIGRGMVWDRR